MSEYVHVFTHEVKVYVLVFICFSVVDLFYYSHGVGGPVVGEIDGEYHYDHKRSLLEWQLPVIDSSNKSGVLEFSIAGHPGDFFPVTVTFISSKSYCDLKVRAVKWRCSQNLLHPTGFLMF